MADTIASTYQEETIDSTGGVRLFLRSWAPASPRAAVVISHGFNSHGGQYLWPAGELAADGHAVYAHDYRGRGKSSGPRFFIHDIQDYVDDLAAVVRLARQRHPGAKVFVLGHSAGGVVACAYALESQQEIDGLICESFAFRVPAPDFVLAILKGLSAVAPNLPVFRLKNADFTRDPQALAALNADPSIANEAQPAGTVAALARAADRLKLEFPRITLPLFILHGTMDKATVPAGSQFFYETAGSSDKTIKLYEGHYHDLLNDLGKEGVMADVKAWIGRHLPG
jgi:alpha-beta hydrolase superfamily lysophospholipase